MLERSTSVQFLVAGELGISDHAASSAPPNVKFLGRVGRDEVDELYRNAHVLAVPTLSDGFAITQLEALSRGLPVIATDRCGEVVSDGVDGFIIPPATPAAIAESIARLDSNRKLLGDMSRAARRASDRFRLPAQAIHIDKAVMNYRRDHRRVPSFEAKIL